MEMSLIFSRVEGYIIGFFSSVKINHEIIESSTLQWSIKLVGFQPSQDIWWHDWKKGRIGQSHPRKGEKSSLRKRWRPVDKNGDTRSSPIGWIFGKENPEALNSVEL